MAYLSINPFTDELVMDYPSHTAEQVEQALSAADAAFRDPSWRGNLDRRLGALSKLAGLLIEHADEIATTLATEMDKLIAQGQGEVRLCAGIAGYYAEHAKDMLKPVSYQSKAGNA